MSGDKKVRIQLTRMANFADDDAFKSSGDDDARMMENQSELEYCSAASSLVSSQNTSASNSLERPLHVNSRTNGSSSRHKDDDSLSSDGNTTYGSPISSPSSPTYYTPSQGSSSEVRNIYSTCYFIFRTSNFANHIRKVSNTGFALILSCLHSC